MIFFHSSESGSLEVDILQQKMSTRLESRHSLFGYTIVWIWPPHSNSGIFAGLQGSPTKDITILVVTGILGRGTTPRYAIAPPKFGKPKCPGRRSCKTKKGLVVELRVELN